MGTKPRRRRKQKLRAAKNSANRHATKWPKSPHEWYVEEPWCSDLLIDALPHWAGGTVLDPAAGAGLVVEAFRRRGFAAIGSDLIDRGYDHSWPAVDFMQPGAWPDKSFDYLAFNAPFYGGAGIRQFVRNALPVARKGIAILAPLPFLAGQQRHRWFKSLPVSLVLVMSARPSMPPGELLFAGEIRRKGGKEDYCWIVCEHGHAGRPQFDWIMPTEEVLRARGAGNRRRPSRLALDLLDPDHLISGPSSIQLARQHVAEAFP